jgi:hypothetical protein
MSLTSVRISEEVWLTCLSHALTTETEEIMGLLLGDTEVAPLSPGPLPFPPPSRFPSSPDARRASSSHLIVVGVACLLVVLGQGRHDCRHMGGVAADEVREEKGQGRGQPRAARRRVGAG